MEGEVGERKSLEEKRKKYFILDDVTGKIIFFMAIFQTQKFYSFVSVGGILR